MTVLNNLITKYNINKSDIGRVEVGTETLIDKSKSAKTHLLSIFGDTFGSDIEGVTSYNACYGGTAALFNSLAWLESSEWDGRYALVICGDIAVYEAGPARPTGGCGALAILLGPDAPLAIEPGVRATHVLDVYDFYKPSYSEYALVDGKLSQWAYLSSVDSCYQRYKSKYSKKHPTAAPVTMDHFDYFAFHSPYNKLVQKGFARLSYIDSLTSSLSEYQTIPPEIKALPIEDTYESRDVETVFRNLSATRYNEKVQQYYFTTSSSSSSSSSYYRLYLAVKSIKTLVILTLAPSFRHYSVSLAIREKPSLGREFSCIVMDQDQSHPCIVSSAANHHHHSP
jgi:hydroxymethylglutaryl-CoA synthase